MTTSEPATPTLSPTGRLRVLHGWAERLSVPVETLTSSGTQAFAREGATAVVVVELERSRVVVGPPAALERIRGLDGAELLDLQLLVASLASFRPRPIGSASLSYRDTRLDRRLPVATTRADDALVEAMRLAVAADEWDESGLATMPQRWAATTPQGRLAALAGLERWGADIAQLGVVATPDARGHGYAAAAAGEVVTQALDDGLVAQWRCREGNAASERLAASLSFTRLGRQLAVDLS